MAHASSAGRKLSVAMIARDAESTIAAALESVRTIADEIVVVDTGSADRTREIAERGASKVVDFKWADDFSAARNFALSRISGDWVLWLDASEQLDSDSAREIRQQLDNDPASRCAFVLMIQLPPGLGQTDGEQVGKLRLYPTNSGLKFMGRVRERIEPALESIGLEQRVTQWRITRSKFDLDPQVKAAKARRDIQLGEREIEERTRRPELFTAIGDAWMALGDSLKAAGRYRQAVDETRQGSTEQLEAYYGLLTTFDGRLESGDRQIATCLEALQIFPLDAQLLCAMASYLQNQGRMDLACRSYQTAVQHGQVNVRTWHLIGLLDVATICYSMTLDLQGRVEDARRALDDALANRSDSERLLRQLIELDIKHNRRQEALAGADKLPAALTERNALRNSVRGACLAAAKQWSASLSHLRSAYDLGCRDPICLRWLASALIATGQSAAAEPVLLHWRAVAPDHPEPRRLLESIQVARRESLGGDSRTQRFDGPASGVSILTGETDKSNASSAVLSSRLSG